MSLFNEVLSSIHKNNRYFQDMPVSILMSIWNLMYTRVLHEHMNI